MSQPVATPAGGPAAGAESGRGDPPKALAATGGLGEGILPFLAGPRALGEEIVPALLRSAARPQRVVAMVPAVVTDDVEATRATAAASLAFYDTIPSYQRVVSLSGVEKAADLAIIGDEDTVAEGIAAYFDAGATEVMVTQTDLAGPKSRDRTFRLPGRLG